MSRTTAPRARSPRPFLSKIKSRDALARALKARAFQGKRVVFTNGCFDLLHPGHVTYLERAKRLGDVLVVALNSDSSVRMIKGPKRPVVTLKDRAKVIAALESVDFVTSFSESTPLKTITLLKPTLIVKGGDWPVDQIVGAKEAPTWGGRARALTLVAGRSTTHILKRLGVE